jgi:hypothetical protein
METMQMIKKANGDASMSEALIKLWYQRFKDGRESVESILEGLQQAEHPKMLNECGLLSMKTGN